jgi:filamentous hemagglutinin family protein
MNNSSNSSYTLTHPLFRKACALALATSTTFAPAFSSAAGLFPGLIARTATPYIPAAGQLPEGFTTSGGVSKSQNGTAMSILQNKGKDKVVIDWDRFNIGSGASVRFYQGVGDPNITDNNNPDVWKPNSNYAVLNRIHDLDPSVINGSLTADGKVYLINRNGIFFGPGGQVQVQSLVASTFKLSEENFNIGRLRFGDVADAASQPAPAATISNKGKISTNSGGTVFFIGPQVQNLGTISAPGGKIDLVGLNAGGEVEIKEILANRGVPQDVLYSDTSLSGDVANMAGGELHSADGGWVGLYGNTVRNDGLIRAVTTRRQNGSIYLSARDLAATGEGSVTTVEVSDTAEAMGRIALAFTPGSISFGGLTRQSASDNTPVAQTLARVDHEGIITAHAGSVTMGAEQRVYLGSRSSIDVSGLSIERSMADQMIEVQLNGVYLRDDYGQKNGMLLGRKVWVDVLKGSSIGNLSSYYLGMAKNAQDMSTTGGSIIIGSPTLTDMIIGKGAGLNLSGGKVTYSGTAPSASKVIGSDGRVYDISSIPQWVTPVGIFGSTLKSYGKFGSQELAGFSFGGQMLPALTSQSKRVAGGDAGALSLTGRVIAGLDDSLNLKAAVTTGFYQSTRTPYLTSDKDAADAASSEYQRYLAHVISLNRGVETPIGAALTIGNSLAADLGSAASYTDTAAINSIAIRQSYQAPEASWQSAPLDRNVITEISAGLINRANLSGLTLFANSSIKTDENAGIVLRAGGTGWEAKDATTLRTMGSYIARSRRIEFLGSITAPGGGVEMTIRPTVTSPAEINNLPNPEYDGMVRDTIFLGDRSRIDTAGERIDNSIFGLAPEEMRKGGLLDGGSITLRQVSPSGISGYNLTTNNENSIVIKQGALLDVSGGWLIDEKGTVGGGNAGSLAVRAPTISLGGELRGFSLPGKNGGELTLHAQNMLVATQGEQFDAGFGIDDQIPTDAAGISLVGRLVLGTERFRDSGFSRISLSATDNLTVADGVQLAPSNIKTAAAGSIATAGTCVAGECYSATYPTFYDQLGKTSMTLVAGSNVFGSGSVLPDLSTIYQNIAARLSIGQGAAVSAGPGDSVTLTAPVVDIAGAISAPGGKVTATARFGDLTVRDTGSISAAGYNKPAVATRVDLPAPLPAPKVGGTVALESSLGALKLEAGSSVDVSGSARVDGAVIGKDGQPVPVSLASDAGSLTLAYGAESVPDSAHPGQNTAGLQLAGEIAGYGRMAGTRGGDLTIKNKSDILTIREADVSRYQDSGFDGLTFSGAGGIALPARLNLTVGRKLTLDTPWIAGSGSLGDATTINAPWIRLINAAGAVSTQPGTLADKSGGSIDFNSTWLDVQYDTQLTGFSRVGLLAARDMTFSGTAFAARGGSLKTDAADLTLQAGRIYPATGMAFTISTPGRTTILGSASRDTGPVWSAGGSLTIASGDGIDQRGYLAAPLGNITLNGGANGRVDLSADSVITTAGSAPVAYGTFDAKGTSWWNWYVDPTNNGGVVTAAPAKSITLKGKEVVVRDGALQDLTGGGSVYASFWQRGIAGSDNPLTKSNRYVILPDGTATRPGDSVYLEALPELGVKAGVYSLLPVEYAFVPGALVIEDTGKQMLPGVQTISRETYPVVGGYKTIQDSSISRQLYSGFSIRPAGDVLKEGDFTYKSFIGGDGGSFTLNATGGAYYGGTLQAASLDGYKEGVATLGAKNVEVVSSVVKPDFSQPLSETLQLSGDALSLLPVGELRLGYRDKDTGTITTSNVTVQDNVSLTATAVTLSASGQVTLKKGALVEATGNGPGEIASVMTPSGTFSLGDGAALKAKSGISLDVNSTMLDANGIMDAGKDGTFSLTANRIVFDNADNIGADSSFHLTANIESAFSGNKNLTLISRGDMAFLRDVNLKTGDSKVAVDKLGGSLTLDAGRYLGTTAVSFSSGEITLLNSGTTKSASALTNDGGSLTLKANKITVAPRMVDTDANGNKLAVTRGNIVFDQFGSVNIDSNNDLVFKGSGNIATGGNLNLSAARITTSSDNYRTNSTYTVADITVDARKGAVSLNGSSGGTAGTSTTPGGSLQILGDSITQTGGLIEVAAGQIGLTATNDIAIAGSIRATGSEQTAASGAKSYYAGGTITLQSDKGMLDLQSGANLDVSAAAVTVADQNGKITTVYIGDSGSIALSAKSAGNGVSIKKEVKEGTVVTVKGAQLAGLAGSGGKGGSLALDSATLDASFRFKTGADGSAIIGPDGNPVKINFDGVGGLDGLSSVLSRGGFNEKISVRSRGGDLALTNGNILSGHEVVVAADIGSIGIYGASETVEGVTKNIGGIKADTTDGSGRIELYAGKNLTIGDKAILSASGTASGSRGGTVILSSQDGNDNSKTFNGVYALNVNTNSAINVSGTGGAGGTVHFRAYQGKRATADTVLNDVNMGTVNGTITGADRAEVEAVKAENFIADTTITQANLATYTTAATTFMNAKNATGDIVKNATSDAIKSRLSGAAQVNHLQAGIEIASASGKNLTIGSTGVTTTLDLKGVNPGDEAVVLTLKSGKDLTISQSLNDARTSIDTLYSTSTSASPAKLATSAMQNSTAINLVAGSDGGANYLGVSRGSALAKDVVGSFAGTGNLTINSGKWVYSENAPIRFAAGNDAFFNGTTVAPNVVTIVAGKQVNNYFMINEDMKYNLGSYGGNIRGSVGRNFNLTALGSVVQSALGNIDIRTGRDLNLGNVANSGAIRTTGEYDNSSLTAKMPGMAADTPANRKSYWTYHNGGSIRLEAGNAVNGNLSNNNGWDGAYADASYYNPDGTLKSNSDLSNFAWYLTAGFGGSREKSATANVPFTVGIATMGGGDISVRSGGAFLTQVGAFGRGDLSLSSGGEMKGRFRVMNGKATITSGGGFGSASSKVVTEMANAQVSVAALGDVHLASVQNPDNSRDRIFYGLQNWNLSYTRDSSFSAASFSGGVTLYGTNPYDVYGASSITLKKYILPATFILSAAGDVSVKSGTKFILAPSERGNLGLYASGSIYGQMTTNGEPLDGFIMQDVVIDSFYGRQSKAADLFTLLTGDNHSGINHLGDTVPVTISAGQDIGYLNLKLNKPLEMTAAGTISAIKLLGQNLSKESVTNISAGGDIDQGLASTPRDANGKPTNTVPNIEVGGPGTLLVQAGGSISLGNSGGINSIGNQYNSAFGGSGADTDSDIIVSAGANAKASLTKADVQALFSTIRTASDDITNLKAAGDTAGADKALAVAEQSIRRYFYTFDKNDPAMAGIGSLDLVDSAISSRAGAVYVMAGGTLNVGKTALTNAPMKTSGITTLYGGDLSVYAGGDVNVNESRIMTYLGGDISVWSDQGNINAGRGSKTVVSAPETVYQFDDYGVLKSVSFTPPSAGSGIRALTFDPDGVGPLQAPEAGKVHIYTPGTLDAGEAGIQGGKLLIAASTVLNSQNITAGAGSVGVPTSNANTVSIGPMSGASDITSDKKMIETISGGGAEAAKKSVLAQAEDFLMQYLDVKVIDLTEGTL